MLRSIAVSYSHTADDVDRTIEVVRGVRKIYRQAMDEGAERHLVGRPSKIVYRRYD